MNRTRLKQGTLAWEKARETRIGGSEIFDIVRYYATDDELQNCGINAEKFRAEKPYTSVWSLYHKMRRDGMYHREALAPEFAEYGHAVEPYGVYVLQKGRQKKVKPGEVYADDRLIISLDVSGTAEEIDKVPFDFGNGMPKKGQKFVCEQKTMMPQKAKGGTVPFKYIVQAQHQIMQTKAHFFILQIMVLAEDTPFIRGKICQMSRRKKFEYLDENMLVKHLYFQNNQHLGELINTCTQRFFYAVAKGCEPTAYIENDSQQNIIECIRQNSLFDPNAVVEYDLKPYKTAKDKKDKAADIQSAELQKIIETAKAKNACKFDSADGISASFSKNGRFLIKEHRI